MNKMNIEKLLKGRYHNFQFFIFWFYLHTYEIGLVHPSVYTHIGAYILLWLFLKIGRVVIFLIFSMNLKQNLVSVKINCSLIFCETFSLTQCWVESFKNVLKIVF